MLHALLFLAPSIKIQEAAVVEKPLKIWDVADGCESASVGSLQPPPESGAQQTQLMTAGVSGQAWATYIPAERAPADGSKPRGASIFARDFQTVVIYDTQGKFVGVRRPGSGLPIQVC